MDGMFVLAAGPTVISDNIFVDNNQANSNHNGLTLVRCHDVTVSDNLFTHFYDVGGGYSNHTYDIYVDSASTNIDIKDNTLACNSLGGVYLGTKPFSGLIRGNTGYAYSNFRQLVPSLSYFTVNPTNLNLATDGDWTTSANAGYTNTSNQNATVGYFRFDLGSQRTVLVSARAGMYANDSGTVNGYWAADDGDETFYSTSIDRTLHLK
jgi:parallel beta-helix repeat protein